MCPCIVANPIVWDILFWAVVILGGIGFVICMALRKLAPVAGVIGLGLYRWFSGATLAKDFGTPEADLKPRKYARHVHAVTRTVLTASVILSLLYPVFFYAVSTLAVGSAFGLGLNRARIWRDNRLAARKADMIEQGEPIRVKAEIGVSR